MFCAISRVHTYATQTWKLRTAFAQSQVGTKFADSAWKCVAQSQRLQKFVDRMEQFYSNEFKGTNWFVPLL